jgi:two-component system, LytTR family, sensor kinase
LEKVQNNNRIIRFLIEPKFRIYRHLLVLLYIACMFVIIPKDPEQASGSTILRKLVWNSYFLVMFYINMYVLIPVFLYKAKYVCYLLVMILMVVGSYLVVAKVTNSALDGYRFVKGMSFPFDNIKELLLSVHKIFLMVFASTSIKLFQRWAKDDNRINELEKSSLQSELRELKNQINPHFLFNMLNNVNVLVKKDPEKASQVILKLSDFLRHQLYGNNQQEVLLSAEVVFLGDFMALEKIRRDEFSFDIITNNKSGNPDRLATLMLPPNLFIPFVENAVKHSFDPDHASLANVVFIIYHDRLIFECSNTKAGQPIAYSASGGLGLINIKRRLELLYATAFALDIKDTETTYSITLTLPL